MNLVRLIFGQWLVHAPVGNPERVTRQLLLRVDELVKEIDLLHEVAADGPHQVVEVVRAISVRLLDPEADIIDARGLLTHRLTNRGKCKDRLIQIRPSYHRTEARSKCFYL